MKVKLAFKKNVPDDPQAKYTWYTSHIVMYDCSSAIEVFNRLMKLRQRQYLVEVTLKTKRKRGRSFRSGTLMLAETPKHNRFTTGLPITKDQLTDPEKLDSLAGAIWEKVEQIAKEFPPERLERKSEDKPAWLKRKKEIV